MPLPHVDYRMVKTVAEALALKQAHPDARFLAGGTDLIPQVREGRRPTSLFIDIKRIPELSRIEERPDGGVLVGAAVTMATTTDRLGQRFPLLTECCLTVGAFPLRNRATMGGNLCNASPAADTAVGLMCLDAEVVAQGPAGVRHVPITEFFQGPGPDGPASARTRAGHRAAAIRVVLARIVPAHVPPTGHGPGHARCGGGLQSG